MTQNMNFGKPLGEFSEEEIERGVNNWDPRFGALGVLELQRRQQVENATQVSKLILEVRALKNITDVGLLTSEKNAQSNNKIATAALAVAITTLFVQFVFSIHQEVFCLETTYIDKDTYTNSDCKMTLDLGLLGTHSYKVPDYTHKD